MLNFGLSLGLSHEPIGLCHSDDSLICLILVGHDLLHLRFCSTLELFLHHHVRPDANLLTVIFNFRRLILWIGMLATSFPGVQEVVDDGLNDTGVTGAQFIQHDPLICGKSG